jgi:hypothetical protein
MAWWHGLALAWSLFHPRSTHERAHEAGAGGGVIWCCSVSPVPCPLSSSHPVLPLSFCPFGLFVCLLLCLLCYPPFLVICRWLSFVLGRCGLYR